MIKIPPIVQPVPLSEYHQDLPDDYLYIWVNPSQAKRAELDQLRADVLRSWTDLTNREDGDIEGITQTITARNAALYGWWAEMFSQALEDFTADDMRQMAEADPAFWEWLQLRAVRVMVDWRAEKKRKVSTTPSM